MAPHSTSARVATSLVDFPIFVANAAPDSCQQYTLGQAFRMILQLDTVPGSTSPGGGTEMDTRALSEEGLYLYIYIYIYIYNCGYTGVSMYDLSGAIVSCVL